MRNRIVILIILLCTAGMHSQNAPAPGPDSIRIDVPLLSLDVTVSDLDGKAITNLNRSDFDLLEDGVPQKLVSFSPVDTPYNVLLLLDCRTSTRDRLNLLMQSLARFSNQLRSNDRMEIATFGNEVHVIREWSPVDKQKIEIDDNPDCNSTDLYGGLDWSVKEVRKLQGRRSVVVFSNGFQTDIARQEVEVNGIKVQRIVAPEKDAEFQKVAKKIKEAGAPFYFIAVDTDLNPGSPHAGPVQDQQQIRARVEHLSEVSGGRTLFPRESSEVVPLFLQIGRELGSSYSLTYSPQHSRDSNYHTIDVQVRGEIYHVQQSRNGYNAN